MFKNYLRSALRNLKHQKMISFINILGLGIGMACCLLIFLYVQDELSYDQYHTNAGRIYRLIIGGSLSGKFQQGAVSPVPMGPQLMSDYPEVKEFVRVCPGRKDVLISHGDKSDYEKGFFYADPSIFKVFTFSLLMGSPETVLNDPYSVVITETIAQKYFGDENPIGKVLILENMYDLKITGVLKNIPNQSHFTFELLASFNLLLDRDPSLSSNWGDHSYFTYILLQEGASSYELEKKIPDFVNRHIWEFFKKYMVSVENFSSIYQIQLQPLTQIHLNSHLQGEIAANSDISYLYNFSIIALLILVIACTNYINLSTAGAIGRAKEVGMRKVVGAQRKQLSSQFLFESILVALMSCSLSILLVNLFISIFNDLAGTELSINASHWQSIFIFSFCVILFMCIFSGSIPAYILSSFRPVDTLKNRMKSGRGGMFFRKLLVAMQFVISIFLIISTMLIFDQTRFLKNRRLGFDKAHVVVIPVGNTELQKSPQAFRQALVKNPSIMNVSASTGIPGRRIMVQTFKIEGMGDQDFRPMACIFSDYKFLETFGIKLKEGRNFSERFQLDIREAFLVNEAFCRAMEWEASIDEKIELMGIKNGKVIGVMKDFHFKSLHYPIEPLVITMVPESYPRDISVRILPGTLPETIAFLEKKWYEFEPHRPFKFTFLDEDFNRLYEAEVTTGKVFKCITFLAIFIACLGLSGLVSFTTSSRTKEIGIRKVLGASVPNIILILSKDIMNPLLMANIIAWPIAYYAMTKWLQNFAYRISIGLWTFILSGIIAFCITMIIVSSQSIKAALTNPADTLHYE